jgi:molybdate/tungstate transport system substrate-binding protein
MSSVALASVILALPLSAAPQGSADNEPLIRGSGSVHVMYAGSLTRFFEKSFGPAFQAATAFNFQGEGRGSVAIANLIKGKVKTPDVFISADPKVNESLQGDSNGNYVSWWVPFARTEMVIAWSPKSRFRADFEAAQSGNRNWESVLEQPGLRLGRTDPELDPKGYRTLFLFQLDEERTGASGEAKRILGPLDNAAQIFPEEQLVARLQIGEIDAGVFYLIEAIEAGLPHLRLPSSVNQGDPTQSSHYARASYTNKKGVTFQGSPILYTVAIPSTVRNRSGAESFAQYLLSKAGQDILAKAGLLPVAHSAEGTAAAIPSTLRPYLDTP